MRGTQRHKIAILQRSKVLPIVTWSFVSRWTPYGITEWHCRNRHGLYQKASRLQTKVRYNTNHLVQNLAKKNLFFKINFAYFSSQAFQWWRIVIPSLWRWRNVPMGECYKYCGWSGHWCRSRASPNTASRWKKTRRWAQKAIVLYPQKEIGNTRFSLLDKAPN